MLTCNPVRHDCFPDTLLRSPTTFLHHIISFYSQSTQEGSSVTAHGTNQSHLTAVLRQRVLYLYRQKSKLNQDAKDTDVGLDISAVQCFSIKGSFSISCIPISLTFLTLWIRRIHTNKREGKLQIIYSSRNWVNLLPVGWLAPGFVTAMVPPSLMQLTPRKYTISVCRRGIDIRLGERSLGLR